jgi:undecaprenyl-diphosphatase
VIVAFIPTAIVGLFASKFLDTIFSSSLIIALALIIGGIIFLFLKTNDTAPERAIDLSYKEALAIGISQVFAIIPGVSRSGATLIGGTLARIPREVIVLFSFILAIPTILGASVVELHHLPHLTHAAFFLIALGTLISFLVALLTMRYMLRILIKKPLKRFGWYRIIIGIIFLVIIL